MALPLALTTEIASHLPRSFGDWTAHLSAWAPFVVVGEGSA
jgi:hypothetical protein